MNGTSYPLSNKFRKLRAIFEGILSLKITKFKESTKNNEYF